MRDHEFQRARSPEQKEERRVLLLETARGMLGGALDAQNLSLSELARAAGMAKSNVYRYFESREAVLLELLWLEWKAWFSDLQLRLQQHAVDETALDLAWVTRLFARTIAERPLLGHLSSLMPSVIEHNVAPERVYRFKAGSLQFLQELGAFLHRTVPTLSAAAYEELIHHSFSLLVGLWPLAHPSDVVRKVLSAPELAPFRHDFERDFARGLLLFARGLRDESG